MEEVCHGGCIVEEHVLALTFPVTLSLPPGCHEVSSHLHTLSLPFCLTAGNGCG